MWHMATLPPRGALSNWARPALDCLRMGPRHPLAFTWSSGVYGRESELSLHLGFILLGPLSWPGEFSPKQAELERDKGIGLSGWSWKPTGNSSKPDVR